MLAKSSRILALLATLPAISGVAVAAQSAEERNLNEVRNTVVNLLQSLVERGVLSREQAETMVKNAQDKAAKDADAAAAQDAAEAGAVRVPYVPEVVKDEIRKQVSAELAPEIAKDVIAQGQAEGWAASAFLPDWTRRVRWSGDFRLRGQSDVFSNDNDPNGYLNYQAINDAGGIGKAGFAATANNSEDRYRMRARARIGLDAELGRGWSVGTRLVTGNLKDPVSTNQTLGNSGFRYQTTFDLAFANYIGTTSDQRNTLVFSGGRIPNPWLSNDLVWDPDLTFEGVSTSYRRGFTRDGRSSHYAYITLGAFPLQEVELSDKDKWLFGGQLGIDWRFDGGSRARMAAAYYYYKNIVGERNAFNTTLLNYTAPLYLQKGNTLIDILNDQDDNTNLFALASNYHLLDANLNFDWQLNSTYKLTFAAEYVKNLGFDVPNIVRRDQGYLAEVNFGHVLMARPGAWRVSVGYRYLGGDSTLDAFADSDFHLGGTDAKGYIFTGEVSLTERVFMRLKYLSANEIEGQTSGIDVLQLDLNTQF
ncbi:MAG: putative porin [Gammaproteobacteria bacterium]